MSVTKLESEIEGEEGSSERNRLIVYGDMNKIAFELNDAEDLISEKILTYVREI